MGTRTPDPLIKSQLLYQLSYAPMGHIFQTTKLYIFFYKMQVFIGLPCFAAYTKGIHTYINLSFVVITYFC